MRFINVCVAAVLLATPLSAQLIKYAEWADGPERHLMTKEEMAEWKTLKSDDRAQAFIDLFWARRDPTPDTPRNEFREQFNALVALANKQFTSARTRGSMSDPGKVLLLLGPPYQISSRGGSASRASAAVAGGSAPTDVDGGLSLPHPVAEAPRQIWSYAHDKKPKFVPYPDFVLVFTDEGQNEWQLAHTERVNPDALLTMAVKAYIVSPNLTQPRFGSASASTPAAAAPAASFQSAELATAYKEFRASQKPVIGPASLTYGEFVTPEGDSFVASQLYVPAGSGISSGQDVTFFSVVENEGGDPVLIHEEPAKVMATGNDSYVDGSVHLPSGHYRATFGIASGKTILSATRTELEVEPLDPAKSAVSPLLLSSSITPLNNSWHADDPFTFGGLKVVPKGNGVFTTQDNLWYFVELRNPGLNEQKTPAVDVQVEISGTTAKGPMHVKLPKASSAEIAPLKGTKDRYALGVAIPLDTFRPGQYTIRVHVVDMVLAKAYDLEKPFKIAASVAPAPARP